MSDDSKKLGLLMKIVPTLMMIGLLAWCTTNNRARQQTMPAFMEIKELFLEQGLIDNHVTNDLAAVAKRVGEPGMNDMLYEAAGTASVEALKWIVSNGADPRKVGALHELTLLQKAAKTPRFERFEYLMSFGHDPKQRTKDGMTLMHLSAQSGLDQRTLMLLVEKGLSIKDEDVSGRQPIHVASVKSLPVLIAGGADINAKDHDGRTPLHHAARDGRNDVVTELIRLSASVYAQDNRGRTPLHLAAMSLSNENIIDTLLAAQALTTVRDSDGLTPKDIAVEARENNRNYRNSIIDKL